ncbi:LysE family transporter [Roseomonas sp. OT10]|uniref:LysE family transporter n=1 Tax=Roseomonas cutis TaxID=2897332 RepID=UPI001E54652D|nr:LysE family transporter [Roseomonas sp. OT10]UFN49887.1 LysE family transporter [Roseomonas sp. OT10]
MHILVVPVELALPYLLVMATPGPNLLLILRASLEPSARAAVAAALCIACEASLAAAVAILGGTLLLGLQGVELAGRIVFAALLARAGWRSLRRAGQIRAESPGPARTAGHFRLGLLSAMSNPLTVPFFAGFFLGRIPPGDAVAATVACGSVFLLAGSWFLLLGRVLSLPCWRALYLRAGHRMETAVGLALLGCVGMALWPLLRA